MPGYLTHTKVLIDTVDWLSDIENNLQKRISDKKQPLSELEKTILERARAVRQLLRSKPQMDVLFPPKFGPAAPVANIHDTDSEEKFWQDVPPSEFGAGKSSAMRHAISQHAYTGSLGPDFPGAAYILAINQRWVYHTMHWGSAKYPWVKAGSVPFIFNALDQALAVPGAAGGKGSGFRPPTGLPEFTAAVMGHCSSVAAHVILNPFIQFALTNDKSLTPFDIQNALDAQLAVGFFQRDDMNSGASWTHYYLENSDDWPPLLELYLAAFNATYQGPNPSDTMCSAFPSIAELKAKFAQTLPDLLKQFPDLEKALAHYQGYGRLFDALAPVAGAVAKQGFDQAPGVKDLLSGYRCRVPKLDRNFLEDGWRNTLHWAIQRGYDHTSWSSLLPLPGRAVFPWYWLVLLWFEAWYVVYKTVRGLSHFSTILEIITFGAVKHPDSQSIADQNKKDWQEQGLGNPWLYLDPFADSYDPGIFNIFTIFNVLVAGLPFNIWNGWFGKGTADSSESTTGEKWYKRGEYAYKIGSKAFGEIWPKVTESNGFKIIDFVISFVFDTLDAMVVGARDEATGKEGDILGTQLWFLQLMRWPFHFLACLLALIVKSKEKGDAGKTETSYTFWDFLFSLIFAGLAAFLLRNQLEKRILGVAGVRWPTRNVFPVLPYLTIAPAGNLKRLSSGMATMRVQVYPDGALQQPPGASNPVYPDDKTPKAYPSDGSGAQSFAGATYDLLQLFDRTKYLSGLMCMTAIRYTDAAADEKKKLRQVFDDWNLDYRTEAEWKTLMETVDGKPGLLEATEKWWTAVQSPQPAAVDSKVLNRLQGFFGLKQTTGTKGGKKVTLQYEDGSPMRNAQFEAVFGDTHVPGQTDDSGVALIDGPQDQGDTYRLVLVSYPQQQTVKES
jgi:hypothetical protein